MPADPPTLRSGAGDLHQWRLWLSGLFGSRYDGLTHFHVVTPGVLLRCGQPHVRDLEIIHATHGLGTIVCARGGTRHPLRGRWFRKQRAWCERTGVRLVHMPFSDKAVPPAEVFDRFLAIVADEASRPVLVHCEQGFHRTGVLCAAYRVRLCQWSVEQALAEMTAYGFEVDRPKRRPLLDAWHEWAQALPRA
ncbi:MAG: tyrosine-protein phosphatase [Phycisphaerae bacterium]|jgi:protein tyrosine/serine phosphatase